MRHHCICPNTADWIWQIVNRRITSCASQKLVYLFRLLLTFCSRFAQQVRMHSKLRLALSIIYLFNISLFIECGSISLQYTCYVSFCFIWDEQLTLVALLNIICSSNPELTNLFKLGYDFFLYFNWQYATDAVHRHYIENNPEYSFKFLGHQLLYFKFTSNLNYSSFGFSTVIL